MDFLPVQRFPIDRGFGRYQSSSGSGWPREAGNPDTTDQGWLGCEAPYHFSSAFVRIPGRSGPGAGFFAESAIHGRSPYWQGVHLSLYFLPCTITSAGKKITGFHRSVGFPNRPGPARLPSQTSFCLVSQTPLEPGGSPYPPPPLLTILGGSQVPTKGSARTTGKRELRSVKNCTRSPERSELRSAKSARLQFFERGFLPVV